MAVQIPTRPAPLSFTKSFQIWLKSGCFSCNARDHCNAWGCKHAGMTGLWGLLESLGRHMWRTDWVQRTPGKAPLTPDSAKGGSTELGRCLPSHNYRGGASEGGVPLTGGGRAIRCPGASSPVLRSPPQHSDAAFRPLPGCTSMGHQNGANEGVKRGGPVTIRCLQSCLLPSSLCACLPGSCPGLAGALTNW